MSNKHYANMQLQPIEVIKGILTPEQFEGYLLGNTIKYAMRQGRKEGTDDAAKAREYIRWLNNGVDIKRDTPKPSTPDDYIAAIHAIVRGE